MVTTATYTVGVLFNTPPAKPSLLLLDASGDATMGGMDTMISQDDLRTALAANVPRLRKQIGMTQAQLSQRVGMHPVTLARIETGKLLPNADLLFSLADVLGVPTDALRQVGENSSKKIA